MAKPIDLTGQRFGRLTVIEKAAKNPARWRCLCDCGNEHIARGNNLRNGNTQSCGCTYRETHTTHGMSNTAIYKEWRNLIDRCSPNYKGHRTSICDRWANSFEAFYADMGPSYKPGLRIDRIDANAGHCPENCQWVVVRTNNEGRKHRKNTRWINTPQGRMSLTDAARTYGLCRDTLSHRLNQNWPVRTALTTPSLRN